MITPEQVDQWFTYHPPSADQAERYQRIRTAARMFAVHLVECTPPGADQTAALRKLRECVMTANASIALEDTLPLLQEATPKPPADTDARSSAGVSIGDGRQGLVTTELLVDVLRDVFDAAGIDTYAVTVGCSRHDLCPTQEDEGGTDASRRDPV
jgi:hypothetical protein